MAASARWSRDSFQFQLGDDGGHTAMSDARLPLGEGNGMTPANLLLAALCACTGITAVSLLRKMKQPLKALTVRAEGDSQPDWPKAFTEIRLVYEISGEGACDDGLVRKAARLAKTQYVAVGGTIELGQGGCQIRFTHRIV